MWEPCLGKVHTRQQNGTTNEKAVVSGRTNVFEVKEEISCAGMEKVRERLVWNKTEKIAGARRVWALEVMFRNFKFKFYINHDKKPLVIFEPGIDVICEI